MLTDALGTFSNGQAITASAASTNYVDLGAPGVPALNTITPTRDVGKGNVVPIRIQVTEAFATLTSLKVAVQVDDNTSFSSPTTVFESEAIPLASLVAGYVFNIEALPRGTNERYMQLYYTVAGSNATAGKVFAAISAGNEARF